MSVKVMRIATGEEEELGRAKSAAAQRAGREGAGGG
jgi:hypothetical protein